MMRPVHGLFVVLAYIGLHGRYVPLDYFKLCCLKSTDVLEEDSNVKSLESLASYLIYQIYKSIELVSKAADDVGFDCGIAGASREGIFEDVIEITQEAHHLCVVAVRHGSNDWPRPTEGQRRVAED